MKKMKGYKIMKRTGISEMKKLKRGFTLAETLVTIAVMGVLASVLIPTLTATRPNQEMVMLKKAYYTASRVINELINDEDYYQGDDLGFMDYCYRGHEYHGARFGDNDNNCDSSDPTKTPTIASTPAEAATIKFCQHFISRMNVIGDEGPNSCTAAGVQFTTADGIRWTLPVLGDTTDAINAIEVNVTANTRRNHNIDDSCRASEPGCVNPNIFNINFDRYGKISVPPDSIEQVYLSTHDTTKSYTELSKKITKKTTKPEE